jgi:hypothetical protein
MDEVYEMSMQPFICERCDNEVPFWSIKIFSKIYFEHEIFDFPRSKSKRLISLLSTFTKHLSNHSKERTHVYRSKCKLIR